MYKQIMTNFSFIMVHANLVTKHIWYIENKIITLINNLWYLKMMKLVIMFIQSILLNLHAKASNGGSWYVCMYVCMYVYNILHINPFSPNIRVKCYIYIYISETSQDQVRLKSETFISSYMLKITWKSFSNRFGGFAYTNSKFIQLWCRGVKINNFKQ